MVIEVVMNSKSIDVNVEVDFDDLDKLFQKIAVLDFERSGKPIDYTLKEIPRVVEDARQQGVPMTVDGIEGYLWEWLQAGWEADDITEAVENGTLVEFVNEDGETESYIAGHPTWGEPSLDKEQSVMSMREQIQHWRAIH
jgi:hypothetical protein